MGNGKMIAPLEQWIIVLPTATFNPLSPTAAALNADITSGKALVITPCLTEDSNFNPEGSTTNTRKSLADEAGVANRGAANYSGLISAFREGDKATNTTSLFEKLYQAVKVKNTPIVLLRRLGRKTSVAPAVGHKYSIAKFVTDNTRTIIPDGDGGPIEFETPLGQQGYIKMRQALA